MIENRIALSIILAAFGLVLFLANSAEIRNSWGLTHYLYLLSAFGSVVLLFYKPVGKTIADKKNRFFAWQFTVIVFCICSIVALLFQTGGHSVLAVVVYFLSLALGLILNVILDTAA